MAPWSWAYPIRQGDQGAIGKASHLPGGLAPTGELAPPHRSGGQSQYIEMTLAEPAHSDDLAQTLEWAQQYLDHQITIELLATHAAMSPRTFARRFRQQIGMTPGAWLSLHRVMLAERLLERGNQTIASISARSGFGSPDTLRRHFARARETTPEQYRRAFHLTGPNPAAGRRSPGNRRAAETEGDVRPSRPPCQRL